MIRILLVLVMALVGCIDENKTDCQNDGDCRGVRVCRDGACVTPDDFANNGLPPRDAGSDVRADAGRGDVSGDGGAVDSGEAVDTGGGDVADAVAD